jgi:hypothetical protein
MGKKVGTKQPDHWCVLYTHTLLYFRPYCVPATQVAGINFLMFIIKNKQMKKTTANKAGTTKPATQNIPDPKTKTGDLPDSPKDAAKLQGDEATLDLPEVKDIPGQEHVHVPRMREMADTTASSDDEEGTILDDQDDEDLVFDRKTNVSKEEAALLQDAADYTPTEEEEGLRKAGLDNTDDEGDPLNEKGFGNSRSGRDLDVPGSEDDDEEEDIGEEDEENNAYSVDEENEDNEKE